MPRRYRQKDYFTRLPLSAAVAKMPIAAKLQPHVVSERGHHCGGLQAGRSRACIGKK
jgi:hypothetical protein